MPRTSAVKYESNVVLIVASFPDSLIKFRGPLMEAFQENGKEIHVAVPDLEEDDQVYRDLSDKGVRVHRILLQRAGVNPISDLRTIRELYLLMRRLNPGLVLSYTIKPVIYGSLAAWLARVPQRFALVTGLGYAFTGEASGKRGLLKRIAQKLYRLALGKVGKVFFQNPDDEALFRQLDILPATTPSFVVNGSGVDVSEYSVSPLPKMPCFLLIARLLGDKGVREYAEAAVKVRSRYPDAQFKLVGWIDDNPDAIHQSELDEWVNGGTLEYLGKLGDVRPAIAECSVYVLPSYREGTPRTVLEAMAMGRAVITTDAPGCRETVNDNENGFLVPVKSVDKLAEAMCRFIENPSLADRMGKRSREIAEEKYDVHKVNQSMLNEMGIKE